LVSIGLHGDQTTVFCRTNDDIILKENILFAHKLETTAFNDMLIYDYYWRLLRNYKIRKLEDLFPSGITEKDVPYVVKSMLHFQAKFSLDLLAKGVLSKSLMAWSYSLWRLKAGKNK